MYALTEPIPHRDRTLRTRVLLLILILLALATLCFVTPAAGAQTATEFPVPTPQSHLQRIAAGTAVPLTGDTGYFWFFNDANVELVIKVLDGTAQNGHFWVFYGALSNVEYTITVTDTRTQAVRTYTNPSGTLASVADTAAF